jgi:hypothetical protein
MKITPILMFAIIATTLAVMQTTSMLNLATPAQGQAIAPAPQIPNGAVTTPKIANGAVTTPKIADHAVTANKIAGVSKLIFGICTANFGPINPHADGSADCPVQGASIGDNVIATPNGGLFDTISFYHADVVDGKVRILVRSNFDGTLPATSTTWAVIVFHK